MKYNIDKTIISVAFALVLLWTVFVISTNDWSPYSIYAECPAQEEFMTSAEGAVPSWQKLANSCDNPFYEAKLPKWVCRQNEGLCTQKYILPGEVLGNKPNIFVKWYYPVAALLLALGFYYNHRKQYGRTTTKK